MQSVYYDKTHEFALSTKSPLPILGVDLPLQRLSELTVHPEWVRSEERWKTILAELSPEDRKYADSVREGVQKLVKEDGHTVFWLFNVREGRVSLPCRVYAHGRAADEIQGFLMQTR